MPFAIQSINIHKSFSRHQVLKGLSINVPKKSVYGFLGNNGAGKSTTIRLLMGLLRADRGEINIFGENINKNRCQIVQNIGTLIEAPSLYSHLTGYEFLEISRQLKGLSKGDIHEALEIVDMHKSANRIIKNYSLGMKQRLALAHALAGSPPLIILDEPTNGLDPSGIKEIRTLLKLLPERTGTTVFLSSHLLDEVQKTASHVGFLQNGVLTNEGPLNDILHSHNGELHIDCSDQDGAFNALEGAGYLLSTTQNDGLIITDITHDDCAKVNRLLIEKGHDLYSSRWKKPSLEQAFFRNETIAGQNQ